MKLHDGKLLPENARRRGEDIVVKALPVIVVEVGIRQAEINREHGGYDDAAAAR
jgi:hypothetical protein